ncbi:MAG: FliM/FliN family flagellar motor C-terminal domain-containing protein [Paracoccus sp. (in: a-proteobacteria)]|uniref:FliM/FliN family flagellar motor switch protein n=1 Tax=Paracoccus sp. TaxID=267 RepID=UPI0026DF1BC4|nr:FliM/FliN family flagellar motor C-terminal domain-containing protein [Paracoccus sp. (in: a-proteobacteria)]MDO5612826.1 FliM/FliN family flagellar motor C-terminal domain-containing protein [Paracoccus sp. (in: a-proteobacteria)]
MTNDSTAQGNVAQGAILRRLLRGRNVSRVDAGQAPGMPQNLPQTPARGAAVALGRAAEELYNLPARAVSVVTGAQTLAELPELLPEPALLAVVAGPGDVVGVVAMDPACYTALIEVQALGRLTTRPVETRRPTRSDAMICADFVNRLLAELQTEIGALDGYEGYRGFAYASHLDDPRPLMLMLEDTGYRTLGMSVTFGAGDARREGRVFVALPQQRPAGALPAPQPSLRAGITAQAKVAAVEPASDGPDLGAAMQDAPVELLGILCRRKVSLGELRALHPGKLLPLPRVSLLDARLETRQGQVLAHGKLGESEGCHAIRLHDPAAENLNLPPEHSTTEALAALSRGADVGYPVEEPPIGDLAQPDGFRTAVA